MRRNSQFITQEELEYEARRHTKSEAWAARERDRAEYELQEWVKMVDNLVWRYPPLWPPHNPTVWRIEDIGWLAYLEISVNLGYCDPRREHPGSRPALKVPEIVGRKLQRGQVLASPSPLNKDMIRKNQKTWRKR